MEMYTQVLKAKHPKGIPILLLHGWGSSLENLRPLGELLQRQMDVYLIDLPGFGQSKPPKIPFGTQEYMECVLKWAKERGLEKIHLMGHSLGGRIGIRLASQHPDLIESLVLMGAAGLPKKRTLKEKCYFASLKQLRKGIKSLDRVLRTQIFHNWYVPKFASIDYIQAGPLKDTLVRVVNENLAGEACLIKSRTLLIWGKLDQETPLELGERYHSIIPRSKLIIFSQHGHFPYEQLGHHLCAQHILSFVTEGGEGG